MLPVIPNEIIMNSYNTIYTAVNGEMLFDKIEVLLNEMIHDTNGKLTLVKNEDQFQIQGEIKLDDNINKNKLNIIGKYAYPTTFICCFIKLNTKL